MSTKLPQSWDKRLEKLTHTCGCNHCDIAPEAVAQFIEDLKDVHEAERMLSHVRSGREQTYTLDAVAKRLGLEH